MQVVKVWDIDTGMKVFEFCNVHNDSPITTIMLDDSGRKLVTGGQDGKIKIWNYNNGSCIRIMDKGIIYPSSLFHKLQLFSLKLFP